MYFIHVSFFLQHNLKAPGLFPQLSVQLSSTDHFYSAVEGLSLFICVCTPQSKTTLQSEVRNKRDYPKLVRYLFK